MRARSIMRARVSLMCTQYLYAICTAIILILSACQDDTGGVQCGDCIHDMSIRIDQSFVDDAGWGDLRNADDGAQDMSVDLDIAHQDMPFAVNDMDAADSSPAMPQPLIIEENCKCYNEAETCVLFPRYGQIRCQLKGTSCTVKEDCGFGYFCAENGVCECEDSEFVSLRCEV